MIVKANQTYTLTLEIPVQLWLQRNEDGQAVVARGQYLGAPTPAEIHEALDEIDCLEVLDFLYENSK